MPSNDTSSKRTVWAGRMLSGLAALFTVFDTGVKLLALPAAIQATVQLGYDPGVVRGLGLIELALLTLYLIPRTAALGAILWTGYLGGAVASNVLARAPSFPNTLFPIFFAAFLWGGLWLRDPRTRALLARV